MPLPYENSSITSASVSLAAFWGLFMFQVHIIRYNWNDDQAWWCWSWWLSYEAWAILMPLGFFLGHSLRSCPRIEHSLRSCSTVLTESQSNSSSHPPSPPSANYAAFPCPGCRASYWEPLATFSCVAAVVRFPGANEVKSNTTCV